MLELNQIVATTRDEQNHAKPVHISVIINALHYQQTLAPEPTSKKQHKRSLCDCCNHKFTADEMVGNLCYNCDETLTDEDDTPGVWQEFFRERKMQQFENIEELPL